jgi:alpha-tubulin suppressor-like RCC1 family protein
MQNNKSINGQALVQDGILYFIPDSLLTAGSYTLTIPENAVVDINGEPNLSFDKQIKVGDGIGASIAQISARGEYSLLVKSNGTLWAWGNNKYGQIGDGTTINRPNPVYIMDGVARIPDGYCYRSFAIRTDSTLWAWGNNFIGQLGDGTEANKSSPHKILNNVIHVAANGHTLAIKTDSTLWAWGWNDDYQLGLTPNTNRNSPTFVMSNVWQASAGSYHTLVVKPDSTLWCWGRYLIRENTYLATWTPKEIMDSVVHAVAGLGISHVIKADGSLWSWGYNEYGQVGNGTSSDIITPVKIMDNVIQVVAGEYHTLAIQKNGTLWAWGRNTNGQLGDGSKTNRTKPVKIMDGVTQVSAGVNHTLAIKADGSLWAWGDNKYGQLGDGTTTNRLSPVCIIEKSPFNHVEDISLPHASQQLFIGDKWLLLPTVLPANSCIETISFESNNPQVATVTARGIIEGKSAGMATITMTVDRNFTTTFTVQVKERIVQVTTSATGYATFYDSQSAYNLPSGLSAQVVTGASNNKLTYKTLTGNVVPQGTAVMLSNTNKTSSTYILHASDSETSYTGTNLLCGSDEATTTSGDGYHYKLSYGPSSTGWRDVFGWYWGAQNGAPFQIEGHKAWLVVPRSNGARGYTIEGDATGIYQVGADEAEGGIYDLQGRRVSVPNKGGLYIQNGHKVVTK